jgi:hypothetical protein
MDAIDGTHERMLYVWIPKTKMLLTKRLVSKTEDKNTTNDTGEAVLAWHLVDGQDKNGINTVRFLLYLRRLRAPNGTGLVAHHPHCCVQWYFYEKHQRLPSTRRGYHFPSGLCLTPPFGPCDRSSNTSKPAAVQQWCRAADVPIAPK